MFHINDSTLIRHIREKYTSCLDLGHTSDQAIKTAQPPGAERAEMLTLFSRVCALAICSHGLGYEASCVTPACSRRHKRRAAATVQQPTSPPPLTSKARLKECQLEGRHLRQAKGLHLRANWQNIVTWKQHLRAATRLTLLEVDGMCRFSSKYCTVQYISPKRWGSYKGVQSPAGKLAGDAIR